MTKITLYEIREYVGNNYSKPLGNKLRNKTRIKRLLKRLNRQNRQFIVVSYKIAQPKLKQVIQCPYQFEIKAWVDIYTFANSVKH